MVCLKGVELASQRVDGWAEKKVLYLDIWWGIKTAELKVFYLALHLAVMKVEPMVLNMVV